MQMPDLIQTMSDLDHKGQTTFWVNFYAKTRYYGGPEDGGWWVEDEELVNAIAIASVDTLTVRRMIDRCTDKYQRLEWGQLNSILGGCELHVRIEPEAGPGWFSSLEQNEYRMTGTDS